MRYAKTFLGVFTLTVLAAAMSPKPASAAPSSSSSSMCDGRYCVIVIDMQTGEEVW